MVSSLAVRAINAGQGAYAATKGALTIAAQTLAREVGVDGIRVNVVVPGFVPGPNTEAMFGRLAERRGVSPTKCKPRWLPTPHCAASPLPTTSPTPSCSSRRHGHGRSPARPSTSTAVAGCPELDGLRRPSARDQSGRERGQVAGHEPGGIDLGRLPTVDERRAVERPDRSVQLHDAARGWWPPGRSRRAGRRSTSASVASAMVSNGSDCAAPMPATVLAFSVATAPSGASALTAMLSSHSSAAAPVVSRSSIAFDEPYRH